MSYYIKYDYNICYNSQPPTSSLVGTAISVSSGVTQGGQRQRHKASALPGGLKPGLGPLRGRVLKDMTWK